MKALVFLCCVTVFSLTPGNVISQNSKIKIEADNTLTVDEVFDLIMRQTDYNFVYEEGVFKDFPKINVKKGIVRTSKLLQECLSGGNLTIIVSANNSIIIRENTRANRQLQKQVSGKVTDENGVALAGVTVQIKGTTQGVATNFDGKYTIPVPDPANVLIFSYIGYGTQEITVGAKATLNVVLKEEINELDAVTITGRYYNTTKREETGSVSKIDSKTIEKQPVNNPLAAMQGHIPGVNITQNTGLPGTNFRIRIRGQNFIDQEGGFFGTRNDPLYIVDGVPYNTESLENTNYATYIVGSAGVSPLNTMNPADIKSIEVLKDADATAIYGSRGANGVVLITTKKGSVGKTQVKINVNTTLSEVTGFVDLLSTEQYLEVIKEALSNNGINIETAPNYVKNNFPSIFEWNQNRYTDWQEVLLGGTAYRQNAQLSFTGGSEYTQFLLSGSYSTETTVFPGDSKYDKATVHINVNHQSKDDRFKLNFSGNYGSDTNNLPIQDLTSQARTLAPNAPALYDNEGNLNWENSTWNNPLAIFETNYVAMTNSLIANAVLSYLPTPALEFKTNLGYTDYHLESYSASPHTRYDPNSNSGMSSQFSSIYTKTGTRQSWIIEPQINWQKEWGDTSLKLLVGTTFQQNKDQELGLSGSDFPSNALILDLTSAKNRSIFQDTASEYKYQAIFGRININWQDKYILNITGRRDGSSRFGPGNQFGNFGAIGAAWLFSEENFLENSTFLNFGKLRASYGITGSDNVGNYKFLDTYSTEGGGTYNGSGLIPTGLFNPDYGWGETKKLEAALELGFLKNRIFFSVAWYHNRSSNQLINTPLPTTTGFSGINDNFNAIVDNEGFEVDLHTINIQRDTFEWRTTFNISANKNKLVAFPGLEGSTFRGLVIGEPLDIASLYHSIGVDPETGVYQFEDYNNDGRINTDDNNWLVDFTPKYFGGLGNTLKYKNLQLDVFFQFRKQKGRTYRFYAGTHTSNGNMPVTILDRWQQPGDENPIQRYSFYDAIPSEAADLYRNSNAMVTDASFIRLRNVSLSYTIPKTTTKGIDVNIYLHGQNLFILTGYDGADPESPLVSVLPPLRQFTLGLSLTF